MKKLCSSDFDRFHNHCSLAPTCFGDAAAWVAAAAAAAEEEHGPAAAVARDPVAVRRLAAAAPDPVGERDPAAVRGHLPAALRACRGRSQLFGESSCRR